MIRIDQVKSLKEIIQIIAKQFDQKTSQKMDELLRKATRAEDTKS